MAEADSHPEGLYIAAHKAGTGMAPDNFPGDGPAEAAGFPEFQDFDFRSFLSLPINLHTVRWKWNQW